MTAVQFITSLIMTGWKVDKRGKNPQTNQNQEYWISRSKFLTLRFFSPKQRVSSRLLAFRELNANRGEKKIIRALWFSSPTEDHPQKRKRKSPRVKCLVDTLEGWHHLTPPHSRPRFSLRAQHAPCLDSSTETAKLGSSKNATNSLIVLVTAVSIYLSAMC